MAVATELFYTGNVGEDILVGLLPQDNLTFETLPNSTVITGPSSSIILPPESFTTGTTGGTASPVIVNNGHPRSMTDAWSGCAYDYINNIMYINGQGHDDGAGNEWIALDCVTGVWSLVKAPSVDYDIDNFTLNNSLVTAAYPAATGPYTAIDNNPAYVIDPDDNTRGARPAVHSSAGLVHIGGDNIFCWGGSLAGGAGTVDNNPWLFDVTTGWWNPLEWRSQGGALGVQLLYDYQRDILYGLIANGTLYTINKTTGARTQLSSTTYGAWGSNAAAYDPVRERILVIGQTSFGGIGNPRAIWFECTNNHGGTEGNSTIIASSLDVVDAQSPALEYIPELDQFVAWSGGDQIHFINPVDYSIDSSETVQGIAPTITTNGMFYRMRWVAPLERLIFVTSLEEPVSYIDIDVAKRLLF